MEDTSREFDDILRIAALDFVAEEAREFDAIDTTGVILGKRLKTLAKKLIRLAERDAAPRVRFTSPRLIAAVIILIALCTLTIFGVTRYGKTIWNTIVSWFDDYAEVTYVVDTEMEEYAEDSQTQAEAQPNDASEGETEQTQAPAVTPPETILEYKKPTGLPADVEEELTLKNKTSYFLDYYIADELYVSYQQTILYGNKSILVDSTDIVSKNVTINGYEAIVFFSQGNPINNLTWSDGVYHYMLSGHLTENELLSIAESIK